MFRHDKDMLDGIRTELMQQLQDLQGAPSVAMHQVPPLFVSDRAEMMDEDDDADERGQNSTKSGNGTKKQHEAELYDTID